MNSVEIEQVAKSSQKRWSRSYHTSTVRTSTNTRVGSLLAKYVEGTYVRSYVRTYQVRTYEARSDARGDAEC